VRAYRGPSACNKTLYPPSSSSPRTSVSLGSCILRQAADDFDARPTGTRRSRR
jgi:hypothetical protein